MSSSETPKPKYLRIVAVILAGVAFSYFIWPTPYKYMEVGVHAGTDSPNIDKQTIIRVNRFNGVKEFGTARGWKKREDNYLYGDFQEVLK